MSLPYRAKKRNIAPAYILIGDGFDELEVVYFLHEFRRAGLPIKSVSLFDQLVFSKQGVGLKTDFALADKPFDGAGRFWLILPSGGRNGETLRQDARVKTLLKTLNAENGVVVVTDERSDLAEDINHVVANQQACVRRSDQNLAEFVERLTQRITVS